MEIKHIDKTDIMIVRRPPFKKWLTERMNLAEYKRMTLERKKEIFLRWKHGWLDKESNATSEISDMNFYKILNQIPQESWNNMEEGMREYFLMEKRFIERCFEIWNSIEDGSFFIDTEDLQNIEEVFGESEVV